MMYIRQGVIFKEKYGLDFGWKNALQYHTLCVRGVQGNW